MNKMIILSLVGTLMVTIPSAYAGNVAENISKSHSFLLHPNDHFFRNNTNQTLIIDVDCPATLIVGTPDSETVIVRPKIPEPRPHLFSPSDVALVQCVNLGQIKVYLAPNPNSKSPFSCRGFSPEYCTAHIGPLVAQTDGKKTFKEDTEWNIDKTGETTYAIKKVPRNKGLYRSQGGAIIEMRH